MVLADHLARLGLTGRVCLVVLDRAAHPDARTLVRVRPQIRALGVEALVVVTSSAIHAFAADTDIDARVLDSSERVREHKVILVDRDGVVRLEHETDALSVEEAIDEAVRRAPADIRVSRRHLVAATLTSGLAMAACGPADRPKPQTPPFTPATATPTPRAELDVTLVVNGRTEHLHVDPRVTLLDAVRERMGLTGTKMGCDMGQCGACTVLVDGQRIKSCLMLVAMADGKTVTTIEGLGNETALHPLQAAFASEDGFQCGFCTPGQIMSAAGLLAEGHATTDDEVREQMSGNICRCGAYPNIVRAVQRARKGV